MEPSKGASHTPVGSGSVGCQVGLVFPDCVEQDQPGLGVIPLDPKQAGRKMSAKPCEKGGDELMPHRAEFMGLAQAGQGTPEGWMLQPFTPGSLSPLASTGVG